MVFHVHHPEKRVLVVPPRSVRWRIIDNHRDLRHTHGDWGGRSTVVSLYTRLSGLQEIHSVDQHLTFHSGSADAIVNGKTVSACVGHMFLCSILSRNVSDQVTSS